MTTLSGIMQSAFDKLGQANVTTATGGSTTTAIDTKLAGRFKNTGLKNGVLFITRSTDGLAPQAEFQPITSYANATQTITTPAFTAAVGSGDTLTFCGPDFPIYNMIEWVGKALQSLGDIELIDASSLQIASVTTEYSLPATWKDVKPWKVEIQTIINQTSNNQWIPVQGWKFIAPATVGAQGKLYLPQQNVNYYLRVTYRAPHPTVTIYSDIISDSIDPEVLAIGAAIKAREWYNAANSGGDKFSLQNLNDLRAEYDRELIKRPTEKPKRSPTLLTIPLVPGYGSDPYLAVDNVRM